MMNLIDSTINRKHCHHQKKQTRGGRAKTKKWPLVCTYSQFQEPFHVLFNFKPYQK